MKDRILGGGGVFIGFKSHLNVTKAPTLVLDIGQNHLSQAINMYICVPFTVHPATTCTLLLSSMNL